MIHFDRGLKLTAIDLAVDFRRRQPRGFISHAHSDHMAPHELSLCTPATAALYRLRHGEQRAVHELPYRTPCHWGGTELITYPAGHVLGSAMLWAHDGQQSLLYTGDFKLGSSATAEAAELREADVLVMECTFGEPRYCLPPREEVVAQLIEIVRRAICDGATPVVHAYSLGKSQEVSRILTDAGIPVLQHPLVYAVSQVYEACGCALGDVREYPGHVVPGTALVAPPRHQRKAGLGKIPNAVSIAVTGWAMDHHYADRHGLDHALPLSDHADYNELLAAVEKVQARIIYCTHGPEGFAERLRKLGYPAYVLDERAGRHSEHSQPLLFRT